MLLSEHLCHFFVSDLLWTDILRSYFWDCSYQGSQGCTCIHVHAVGHQKNSLWKILEDFSWNLMSSRADKKCCREKHSDREIVEFGILRRGSRAESRIITLDFRRADFAFFKESWLTFSHHLCQAPECSILLSRTSGKNAGRLTWMNKELLAKSNTKWSIQKVEAETSNLSETEKHWACRDEFRKIKAHLELNWWGMSKATRRSSISL